MGACGEGVGCKKRKRERAGESVKKNYDHRPSSDDQREEGGGGRRG